jgi:hypothetical protein
MEAYYDEVRRLEDKFYGLELNHIARRYNETADELAKIASGRTTVPPDVFSRDLHQPSVKIDDAPEPEAPSAQPEVPSAQPEAPSARPGATSVRPEVLSAPEGETLHVEGEQCGVTPDQNWQTPYLRYLHRGELPLDRAEARRLARRAKSFVLLGEGKELYHRSPSGILQRWISTTEGQELLREIHTGACGHHAAPRALIGNAFRQGFYWPTAVADATRIVRACEGCQFYARQTHLLAQALQTIPITWPFVVWGLDLVGPLQKAPGGYTHLLVAIDKFSKWIEVRPLNSIRSEQAVAFFTNIVHRFQGPELHHHRQWHPVHWQKVPGLLRRSPHPGGLGRRGSSHDEWASRACQWHDSTRTQASDLQRPQQVRQAMDEGTPLGGLEPEDNTEPSHGLHAVLSSLWGQGHLAHRPGVRFPEDEGLCRPKQPS